MKIEGNLLKFKQLVFILENCSLDNSVKQYLIYKVKRSFFEEQENFSNIYEDIALNLKEKLNPNEYSILANEFNKKIVVYSKINYTKPPLNIIYYLREYVPDFKTIKREDFIEKISSLDEEDIKVLLQSEIVRRKLRLEELDEKDLNDYAYAFHNNISHTAMRYVKHLGIDIKTFLEDERCQYHNIGEENHIVRNFGVSVINNQPKRKISVADIVGHDACRELNGKNILYTFPEFYDYQKSDLYRNRANGLLKYTTGEELVEELARRNYETRDMNLRDLGDGTYEISSNGMHRFTVLRILYLQDLLSNKYTEEELYQKYLIPVNVPYKLDYNRTYCNYLIKQVESNVSFIEFFKGEITVCFKNGNKKTINEDELLYMARKSTYAIIDKNPYLLTSIYKRYDTFKKFIDQNMPEIKNKMTQEDNDEFKLI